MKKYVANDAIFEIGNWTVLQWKTNIYGTWRQGTERIGRFDFEKVDRTVRFGLEKVEPNRCPAGSIRPLIEGEIISHQGSENQFF